MEATTKRAMTGITIEDQIKAIHQSQGLAEEDQQQSGSRIGPAVPKMPPPPSHLQMMGQQQNPYMMKPNNPPPMQHQLPPQGGFSQMPPPQLLQQTQQQQLQHQQQFESDEPASKRLKTEDNLIGENEFLALHGAKGPVTFHIQIPQVSEKPEWNLNGQTITLVMELTETVKLFRCVFYLQHKIAI